MARPVQDFNDSPDIDLLREKANDVKAFEAFITETLELVIEAYNALMLSGDFKNDWPEETISAALHYNMHQISASADSNIVVFPPEGREYTAKHRKGLKAPKTAKRPDIMVCYLGIYGRPPFLFEAKLVKKNSNTCCRAYISEAGMRKFINRLYEGRGAMLGYIMHENAQEVMENINNEISKEGSYSPTEILKFKNWGIDYDYIYESHHTQIDSLQQIDLRHLFLIFPEDKC